MVGNRAGNRGGDYVYGEPEVADEAAEEPLLEGGEGGREGQDCAAEQEVADGQVADEPVAGAAGEEHLVGADREQHERVAQDGPQGEREGEQACEQLG